MARERHCLAKGDGNLSREVLWLERRLICISSGEVNDARTLSYIVREPEK